MPGALGNGKESVSGVEGPKACVSDEIREKGVVQRV